MTARAEPLAILVPGSLIVLEVYGCSPWQPDGRGAFDHGRELMDVIHPAAQEREYSEASVLKRWQANQGLAVIARIRRLNEQFAKPTAFAPREAALDRLRTVLALGQR